MRPFSGSSAFKTKPLMSWWSVAHSINAETASNMRTDSMHAPGVYNWQCKNSFSRRLPRAVDLALNRAGNAFLFSLRQNANPDVVMEVLGGSSKASFQVLKLARVSDLSLLACSQCIRCGDSRDIDIVGSPRVLIHAGRTLWNIGPVEFCADRVVKREFHLHHHRHLHHGHRRSRFCCNPHRVFSDALVCK